MIPGMNTEQQGHDRSRQAIDRIRGMLKADPTNNVLWLDLGDALSAQGWNTSRFNLSLACYQKSLECRADNPLAYQKMSRALKRLGKKDDALASVQKALALDPDFLEARFSLLDLCCPILFENDIEIASSRAAYERHLNELCDLFDHKKQDELKTAWTMTGEYPFHLAYQGRNDVELQRKFGDLICRIQAAKYPQWVKPLPLVPQKPGERLRIGIVSGFFRIHATWNFPTSGLLEAIDRNRFALYGYHTGARQDKVTDLSRASFDRFVENDFSLESLCEKILSDRLHLLLYPEIGMNRLSIRLSSLRLAPVQCVSWGHSTTSGRSTMDYFLSSDLMEPENGAEHYSETLIRIPNIGVFYPPPKTEKDWVNRQDLGLRDGDTVFLCLQSLFKYLPQYDSLLPRIAMETGNCRFVFITRKISGSLVGSFRRRLSAAFSKYGLKAENHTVFFPFLEDRVYYSLYRIADAFLDSVGWSGCNTTLDALARHLPVVTLPGDLMRGRQSMALLKMMGITDTIAATEDDYVRIAAKLGKDKQWRNDISRRMSENKHKLYADRTAVDAMEEFFINAAAGATPTRKQ